MYKVTFCRMSLPHPNLKYRGAFTLEFKDLYEYVNFIYKAKDLCVLESPFTKKEIKWISQRYRKLVDINHKRRLAR